MASHKTTGPIALGFICALIVILGNFFEFELLSNLAGDVKNFASIIAGFALFLGLVGIVRLHSNTVIKRGPQMPYSASLLIVLLLYLVVGLGFGQQSSEFQWIYDTIYGPLTATTYALLAFWVCSAAYRAFKIKNLESGILVICGILVFFGVTPLSAVISSFFPAANTFISNVINVAGQRGLSIGIGIGILAFGFQIILGLERSWMGAD
jgi:type IV secretory pathway VirB2 component (pilin)